MRRSPHRRTMTWRSPPSYGDPCIAVISVWGYRAESVRPGVQVAFVVEADLFGQAGASFLSSFLGEERRDACGIGGMSGSMVIIEARVIDGR
jgi:hypothetical protein